MFWRLIILGLWLWCSHARADAPPSPRVEVTAAGAADSVAALEQRTRALLQGYAVDLQFGLAPQFRAHDVFNPRQRVALARIWLDARDTSRAILYVVDDAHERFLVRVVPLEAGYDEVACESIGTIVQSSVEALLSGAAVGVDRAEAEAQVTALEPVVEPAPRRTQPPAKSAPVQTQTRREEAPPHARLGLDVGYRGQLLHSAPVLVHGPEIGITLTSTSPGVAATGQLQMGYRVPFEWNSGSAAARFTGAGARLTGGLRQRMSPSLGVGLLAVLGTEWVHVTPAAANSDQSARAAFSLVQPIVGAAVEAELAFGTSLAGWLTCGVESDLGGNHFDVEREGARQAVLVPWPIQAVVRMGARFSP